MFKKLAAITAAAVVCGLLFGCSPNSDNNNTAGNISRDTSADEAFEEMLKKIEPPANVIKIDMKADDPSNDEIIFKYDEEDRIESYTYTVNGIKVLMTYDYDYPEEGKIWALGFDENGTVISEKSFLYSKEAAAKGFSEHDGYYFKNVEVQDSTL